MGLLDKAGKMLSKAIAREGKNILYSGDGDSIVLSAIEGKSEYTVEKAGSVRVEITDADFIFPADKLVLAGKLTKPQRGHVIEKIDPDRGNRKYQVFNLPGERCFRETAGMIRVHTKLAEAE